MSQEIRQKITHYERELRRLRKQLRKSKGLGPKKKGQGCRDRDEALKAARGYILALCGATAARNWWAWIGLIAWRNWRTDRAGDVRRFTPFMGCHSVALMKLATHTTSSNGVSAATTG